MVSSKSVFEKRHGVKPGFMSLFVKAATEALKRFPAVNALLMAAISFIMVIMMWVLVVSSDRGPGTGIT